MIGYEYTVRIRIAGDWYMKDHEGLEELLGEVIGADTEGAVEVEVKVLDEVWIGP